MTKGVIRPHNLKFYTYEVKWIFFVGETNSALWYDLDEPPCADVLMFLEEKSVIYLSTTHASWKVRMWKTYAVFYLQKSDFGACWMNIAQ